MINILPEFESRQVLTSDELNWLACYLDTQNRQSRRFLTGCGLVGGLQVRLNNNEVQISNGVGLSSAGHIVLLSNTTSEFTTYTKIKKYALRAKEKLAFHYVSDLDITQDDYSQSVDVNSLYFANFKSEVFELLEDNVNAGELINAGTIKDKVVLLFAEIIQKELKDCEDDNCQERGKKYIYNTKALVISKEDALVLLNAEYNIQTTSEDAISKLAYPWLHLPNINILKPVFSNFPVNNGFDENLINQEYLRCIKDFIVGITDNKVLIDEALTNLKNYCTSGKSSIAVIQSLLDLVAKVKVLGGKEGTTLYQIIYDYLWCFVKAYQELQVTAQDLKAKCFTNESAFPNHILLGVIDNQNADFDASQSGNYSIYRHSFQSRFVQSEQAAVSKKVTLLLNRLQILATGFDEGVLTIKDIKLTTGGSQYSSLSAQAVPYYLIPTAAKNWNQWSGQARLNSYTTSYGTTNEGQVPSVSLPYNTLPSGFQGNHSFFRIEGIHGQVALTALNSVFQLRKKHGLPFEVLMLRLNEKAPFSNSFNFSINEDIESMYQVVRAETLKQIALNVNYLGALQFKTGKFSTIQTALTRELENSYMLFLNNINATILAQPLKAVLKEAILASNITTNNKTQTSSLEPRFSELEVRVSESRPVSNSFMKKESTSTTLLKNTFLSAELFRPNIELKIGILFFNTLGNLVNTIKSSDKFKKTTDISFYTHLLAVVKAMQKSEKTEILFLLSLQLYCALKLQDEYLTENFLELEIQKYKDNLEEDILPATNAIIVFLKKLDIDFVRTDAILAEVVTDEMLDYTDRIKFDDDWVKIIQLDLENKKRNGGLGVENLLERFVKLHPGMAHGFGVPKGGTYIMVYDKSNRIIADFHLPYIISSHLRPIQYTLLENKTLTLSGTVKDENGNPVEASLLVGNTTVVADKQGFYNVLVSENSTIKIVFKAAGFENFEKEIKITDQSLTEDISLKKSNVKATVTIRFVNQEDIPITKITLKNLVTGEIKTENGVLKLEDSPNTTYKYVVTDERFEDKEFGVTLLANTSEETVKLIEINFIRIQIVSTEPNGYQPNLLKNIKLSDPELELDMRDIANGTFVTKERIDITKTFTAEITYNNQIKSQSVKPGDKVNEIKFEAEVPDSRKAIKVWAMMTYPASRRVNKIPLITISRVDITINPETNLGNGEITTNGKIPSLKNFKNTPTFAIGNFSTISTGIFLLSAELATNGVDIIETNSSFSFNKAMSAAEIRKLTNLRNEFGVIAQNTDLKVENFYCLILPEPEIKEIRTLLNV